MRESRWRDLRRPFWKKSFHVPARTYLYSKTFDFDPRPSRVRKSSFPSLSRTGHQLEEWKQREIRRELLIPLKKKLAFSLEWGSFRLEFRTEIGTQAKIAGSSRHRKQYFHILWKTRKHIICVASQGMARSSLIFWNWSKRPLGW